MHLLDTAVSPAAPRYEIGDGNSISASVMIRHDQARITALIERYRNGPRDLGRNRLLEQIRARLVLHLAIGDQLLCPLLRGLQPVGHTLDEISIGHYVIEQLLRRMQDAKASSRQRDALMSALDDYLEQFFAEEQDALLVPLQAGPIDLDQLGERILAEKRRIAPWLGLDEREV